MCHLLTPPNIFSIFAIDPIPILGCMYMCFYLYDPVRYQFHVGGPSLLFSALGLLMG